MVAIIHSCEILGIEAIPVNVEVDISQGLPKFSIVGLPDTSVNEAKERVRVALKNSGLKFPMKRIAVNLSPAHLKKLGSRYDLAIAIGILISSEVIKPAVNLDDFLFMGELTLDGKLNHINGILPQAILARKLKKTLIIPYSCLHEAEIIKDVRIIGVKNLTDALNFIKGDEIEIDESYKKKKKEIKKRNTGDFRDILGQHFTKRGFEIAAAGFHNILMAGPPGSGKTLMAKSFPSILPEMTEDESLEVTNIYSITGLLENGELIRDRVFRSPHSSISDIAMVGGTSNLRPGEVTLAHNGVLFLDELPEFRKSVLEMLRTPLSNGNITISRSNGTMTYPAKFLFIGATNPCPCGFLGDKSKECTCNEYQIRRYRNKLSGPILDRIDLHVEVSRVNIKKLKNSGKGESSDEIRKRVKKAISIQQERFSDREINFNSQMGMKEINDFCRISSQLNNTLNSVSEKMGLSLRAYHKILKVSRTIADLQGIRDIRKEHILEAVSYRFLDRNSLY